MRKCFWSRQSNSKGSDIDDMCQWSKYKPTDELLNGLIPDPHIPPNSQNGCQKSSPSKFQPNDWRQAIMPIEHIWQHIDWLLSDVTNNLPTSNFSKSPNWLMEIEPNMWDRQAAWSPLWWWPCKFYIQNRHHIVKYHTTSNKQTTITMQACEKKKVFRKIAKVRCAQSK